MGLRKAHFHYGICDIHVNGMKRDEVGLRNVTTWIAISLNSITGSTLTFVFDGMQISVKITGLKLTH